jgi:NDP-sugar pyrophosphorylase family protein
VGHEWLLQIEALKAAGVNEVVLAINYQPEVKTEFTNQRKKSFFVQFYSVCPLWSNDFSLMAWI